MGHWSQVTIKNIKLNISVYKCIDLLPSVLWRCWLGGRKGIRPVKTEWWSAGVVICLEPGADMHIAQLMPLPLAVSCSSKIQIGFTFLVPAHLGSPEQRAVKRLHACMQMHWFHTLHCAEENPTWPGPPKICCIDVTTSCTNNDATNAYVFVSIWCCLQKKT